MTDKSKTDIDFAGDLRKDDGSLKLEKSKHETLPQEEINKDCSFQITDNVLKEINKFLEKSIADARAGYKKKKSNQLNQDANIIADQLKKTINNINSFINDFSKSKPKLMEEFSDDKISGAIRNIETSTQQVDDMVVRINNLSKDLKGYMDDQSKKLNDYLKKLKSTEIAFKDIKKEKNNVKFHETLDILEVDDSTLLEGVLVVDEGGFLGIGSRKERYEGVKISAIDINKKTFNIKYVSNGEIRTANVKKLCVVA